jgi:hypothetical protein
MKKLLLLVLVLFMFSCSGEDSNKPWVVHETKQIISDYPDTLESSIGDARKVQWQMNQNTKDLEKQLQWVRK